MNEIIFLSKIHKHLNLFNYTNCAHIPCSLFYTDLIAQLKVINTDLKLELLRAWESSGC